MDSNHRRLTPTGLQPVPFGHSGTRPERYCLNRCGLYTIVFRRIKGVTVFINGQKVIDEFTPPGPTFLYDELQIKEGDAAGPILLQGDHRPIKYRHVMIKPLKK